LVVSEVAAKAAAAPPEGPPPDAVETKSLLADKEVNVLQAVNLALSTSAFLALADAVPQMFALGPVKLSAWRDVAIGEILYAALIGYWTVKLLVENHKSFATQNVTDRPVYSIFRLMMTVVMTVPLIVSAKMAGNIAVSSGWLGVTMIFGTIWLIVLGCSFEKFIPRQFKWWWVISALGTLSGSALLWSTAMPLSQCWAVLIVAAMLLLVILDSYYTETFSLKARTPKAPKHG
jgi:hypothetical protein